MGQNELGCGDDVAFVVVPDLGGYPALVIGGQVVVEDTGDDGLNRTIAAGLMTIVFRP